MSPVFICTATTSFSAFQLLNPIGHWHTSQVNRVGQSHIYTAYIYRTYGIWYFWQENHQIYGHIRRIYTVLANPTCEARQIESALAHQPVKGWHRQCRFPLSLQRGATTISRKQNGSRCCLQLVKLSPFYVKRRVFSSAGAGKMLKLAPWKPSGLVRQS
jgi:hypothetical protein